MSYALHGAGLVNRARTSGDYMRWGKAGKGSWITVYAHSGHGFLVIAGLRFDTGWNNSGRAPGGATTCAPPASTRSGIRAGSSTRRVP